MHVTRAIRLAPLASVVSLVALATAACAAGPSDSTTDGRGASTTAPMARTGAPDTTIAAPSTTAPEITVAAPATPSTVAEPVRPTGTIDTLLPIGDDGARLHLRCAGSGRSTVVLVAGFGAGGEAWEAVAPGLAGKARVCSYDRFGTGTSDAPPIPQSFTSEADDLHELLQAAGEPGPYVVVGHSFGGAEAVAFTSHFADEVEGLLLLDASPVGWPSAVCSVPDDGSPAAADFRDLCATITDPAKNPERLDAPSAFADIASIRTLGDVPLTVTSRADLSYPGLPATINSQLAKVWTEGQAHWASLSSAARLVTVADTSHNIQIDQPGVVIDQILFLLTQAPKDR